jgi:hypothetical protein
VLAKPFGMDAATPKDVLTLPPGPAGRLPFAVEFDQPCIKPKLRRAEANQFLEELEGLLREAHVESSPN